MVNIDKECFDKLNKYCDTHGLKVSPFISSIIDEKIGAASDKNRAVSIKTDDVGIHLRLHELFTNILYVDARMGGWIDDIIKTGNSYVKLDIEPNKGITGSYLCKNLIRRKDGKVFVFKSDTEELDCYRVLHFRHLASGDSLPYGVAINFIKKIMSKCDVTSNICKIGRLSRIVESELTKASLIHLYALGYRGDDLVNFKLTVHDDFIRWVIQSSHPEIKCR